MRESCVKQPFLSSVNGAIHLKQMVTNAMVCWVFLSFAFSSWVGLAGWETK